MFAVTAMCTTGVLAGGVEDVQRYIDQFGFVDQLSFDAQIRTVMLVPIGPRQTMTMESEGGYHYAFDTGRFVVESHIVSEDPRHTFMDRVSLFAHTGESYLVYTADEEMHETFDTEMTNAVTSVAANPMLLPLGFLRCDLDPFVLMGLEHFRDAEDREQIEKNIKHMRLRTDGRAGEFIEIELHAERNVRGSMQEETYHIYLNSPGEADAGFGLPKRIEMFAGGERAGMIVVAGYSPVRTESGVVYLPDEVTYTLHVGGELAVDTTEVKVNAEIGTYSTEHLSAHSFRSDLAEEPVRVMKEHGIQWRARPSLRSETKSED